jgi:hypothetical protein
MEQSGFEALSKRKQEGKAHHRSVFEDKSLLDLIADKSLRELCEMESEDFLRCSRDAIHDAINYMKHANSRNLPLVVADARRRPHCQRKHRSTRGRNALSILGGSAAELTSTTAMKMKMKARVATLVVRS